MLLWRSVKWDESSGMKSLLHWSTSTVTSGQDARFHVVFWCSCSLGETRSGEICNACVLLVKRWKKLPVGSKKNWNHVSTMNCTRKLLKMIWWLYDRTHVSVCFTVRSGDLQVVDARGGPSLKMTVKSKKVKPLSRRIRPSQICRVQNELKRNSECDKFWI